MGGLERLFGYVLSMYVRATVQKCAQGRQVNQKLFISLRHHGGSIGHQKKKPIGIMLRIGCATTYLFVLITRINQVQFVLLLDSLQLTKKGHSDYLRS